MLSRRISPPPGATAISRRTVSEPGEQVSSSAQMSEMSLPEKPLRDTAGVRPVRCPVERDASAVETPGFERAMFSARDEPPCLPLCQRHDAVKRVPDSEKIANRADLE
jgi:hypothetical protein